MTELKTLKDTIDKRLFKKPKSEIQKHTQAIVSKIKKELKEEAIKEIKLARDSKNGTKGLFGRGINFMFTRDVIEYIKWKFNVEEEELK